MLKGSCTLDEMDVPQRIENHEQRITNLETNYGFIEEYTECRCQLGLKRMAPVQYRDHLLAS